MRDVTYRPPLAESGEWDIRPAVRNERERRFRAVLDAVPAIAYEYDVAGRRLLWFSENAERITGWPSARWTDEPDFWRRHLHPHDIPQVVAQTERAIRDARSGESGAWRRAQLEYRLRHADGQYHWYRDDGSVVVESGTYLVRGVMTDISEEKRRSRRDEALTSVIAALSGSLEIEQVLRQVVATAAELLDTHAALLLVPGECGTVLRLAAYDGPPALEPPKRIPLADPRSILARAFLLREVVHADDDADDAVAPWVRELGLGAAVAIPVVHGGEVIGVLGLGRRRSQRAFSACELADASLLARKAGLGIRNARLYSEARSASEAKSAFLSTMSHELRTPLNALDGFLALLEMEVPGKLNERQRDFVMRARRAGGHLIRIIDDVLDFARIERGRIRVSAAPFPIAVPVRQALEIVRPQMGGSGVSLLGGEIPDDLIALGDVDRVRQILINLLGNAVKFTDAGEIRVGVVWDDEYVVVRVVDTGRGIPSDQIGRIFEPFYQVDNSLTRAGQGTGLGLAVSRSLAQAMGGELAATSQLGRGSTFILTLPRHGARPGGR